MKKGPSYYKRRNCSFTEYTNPKSYSLNTSPTIIRRSALLFEFPTIIRRSQPSSLIIDDQTQTRVEHLKTLDAKNVIVGEEKSKQVLEAFTRNRKKRKLPTEGVVAMSFVVYPIHHNIYQDMEILVPRAKAQAESQKRPWVPFEDRLKGWMIERRARRDNSPIQHDMYYYHKSGVYFRSKNLVIKFVLHNEYPSPASTDRDDRGARLEPESGSVKSSKPKRAYKRKLLVSSGSPISPSAPSSPKRQRIGDEKIRIDIDSPREETAAAQDWLSFVKATAPQDATVEAMNEEGEPRFGKLVDQVLELVAREESEADHQTISAPDPISSVNENENQNQNQDGSRVGAEVVNDGANLAVVPSNIEVVDVAPVEGEFGVPVAEDVNHTSKNGKGNDHVECVVGAAATTNWYVAPRFEEETYKEGMISAAWLDSKTLEDPTMPNAPATEDNHTITNASEQKVSFQAETHKVDNESDDWWKTLNPGNSGDDDLYSIVRSYANLRQHRDRNPNPNPNPDFKSPQIRGFDDTADYANVGPSQVGDRNQNPNPNPDFKSPQFPGFDDGVTGYNYLDDPSLFHPSSWDFDYPGPFNF